MNFLLGYLTDNFNRSFVEGRFASLTCKLLLKKTGLDSYECFIFLCPKHFMALLNFIEIQFYSIVKELRNSQFFSPVDTFSDDRAFKV